MTVLFRSRFREKRLKYIRMIRVHAEVVRNTNSAVDVRIKPETVWGNF